MNTRAENKDVKPLLYHSEVYMPEELTEPVYTGGLHYSAHARREAQNDRYGSIPLPKYFWGTGAQLIEVETVDDVPVKQVWRQPLDEERDLVMAITREGTVKTVWVNLNSDEHKTLNKHRYVKRPKCK